MKHIQADWTASERQSSTIEQGIVYAWISVKCLGVKYHPEYVAHMGMRMGPCPACAADHCHPTKPTLLDLEARSISPNQIFTRLLVRHGEIGLSQRQLYRILSIYRKYRNDYSTLQAKLRLSADELLEAIYQYPQRSGKISRLVEKRAAQFKKHEMLYSDAIAKMRRTITEKQYDLLCRVYIEERRQQLEPLESSIKEALRPVFVVKRGQR